MYSSLPHGASPTPSPSSSALACVLVIRFVSWASFSMMLPTLAIYLESFASTPHEYLAFAVAAFGLGDVLGARAATALARSARSWQLASVAGLLVGLIGAAAYALAPFAWTVIAARFVIGLCAGTDRALTLAFSYTCPPADETRVRNALSAVTISGFALGPVVGIVGAQLGTTGVVTGGTLPGFASAALFALALGALAVSAATTGRTLAAISVRDETSTSEQMPALLYGSSSSVLEKDFRALASLNEPSAGQANERAAPCRWASPRLALLVTGAGYCVAMLVLSLLETIVAPLLIKQYSFGLQSLCLVYLGVGAAMCVGVALMIALSRRLAERSLVVVGYVGGTLGLLAMTRLFSSRLAWMLVGLMLAMAAWVPLRTALLAVILAQLGPDASRRIAIVAELGLVVRVLGPFYAVAAYSAGGPRVVFAVAGGAMALALVATLAVFPALRVVFADALAYESAGSGAKSSSSPPRAAGEPRAGSRSPEHLRSALQSPALSSESSPVVSPRGGKPPHALFRETPTPSKNVARPVPLGWPADSAAMLYSGNLSANFSATTSLHQALLFGHVAQSPRVASMAWSPDVRHPGPRPFQ